MKTIEKEPEERINDNISTSEQAAKAFEVLMQRFLKTI